MTVSLVKGGNLSLSKAAPSMTKALIGLGWDARATDGQDFDLDASVFLLGQNGLVRGDSDFIFYNNQISSCGSAKHGGDNQTGDGDGDDETVLVDLALIPSNVSRIAVCVTIYDAEANRQNFGQVSNAFIRVVDSDLNQEIVRYDLSEDASVETAMVFGELYRNSGEWKFKAVGQGFNGGLHALAKHFGVNV